MCDVFANRSTFEQPPEIALRSGRFGNLELCSFSDSGASSQKSLAGNKTPSKKRIPWGKRPLGEIGANHRIFQNDLVGYSAKDIDSMS